mgnify:FL=1|jgi:hypothetical protein
MKVPKLTEVDRLKQGKKGFRQKAGDITFKRFFESLV